MLRLMQTLWILSSLFVRESVMFIGIIISIAMGSLAAPAVLAVVYVVPVVVVPVVAVLLHCLRNILAH